MERISYAGDTVVSGTEIARALLAYAEALAMREASATVQIPIRLSDGSRGYASILIGPASQLISQTEPAGESEIEDPELVQRLVTMTAALGIARPVTSGATDEDNASYDIGELDILDYDPSDDGSDDAR